LTDESADPQVAVKSETNEVRAVGELLTREPGKILPMAQQ
jgi:urease alpha subunit